MFRHILIGYDGSAHAQKALEKGLALAHLTQAAVTLVTAFPDIPTVLGSPQYDQLVEHATLAAREMANRAAAQARAQGFAEMHVEVIEGSPAECIMRVAEVRGCDCIVVGTRGLGVMAGLLLGSVSERLARHATVPVLLVK
jgi:nucleotide-binding universal stress UspA family protein